MPVAGTTVATHTEMGRRQREDGAVVDADKHRSYAEQAAEHLENRPVLRDAAERHRLLMGTVRRARADLRGPSAAGLMYSDSGGDGPAVVLLHGVLTNSTLW